MPWGLLKTVVQNLLFLCDDDSSIVYAKQTRQNIQALQERWEYFYLHPTMECLVYYNKHILFILLAGGLLIASAHFGAYVCGTDIDYNIVHGLGMSFSLFTSRN